MLYASKYADVIQQDTMIFRNIILDSASEAILTDTVSSNHNNMSSSRYWVKAHPSVHPHTDSLSPLAHAHKQTPRQTFILHLLAPSQSASLCTPETQHTNFDRATPRGGLCWGFEVKRHDYYPKTTYWTAATEEDRQMAITKSVWCIETEQSAVDLLVCTISRFGSRIICKALGINTSSLSDLRRLYWSWILFVIPAKLPEGFPLLQLVVTLTQHGPCAVILSPSSDSWLRKKLMRQK